MGLINDFVIKFANVNGSGSASANSLFTKAILRMGIPATPRNIFPSNIQGLPTWYEVRVSTEGWLGRKEGIDFLVAMNPETVEQDISELKAGGNLLYDSTKSLPVKYRREDINSYGLPFMSLCNEKYDDPRQRQLFKNIMYIGSLSALVGMKKEILVRLITELYGDKKPLIESNLEALSTGFEAAESNFTTPSTISIPAGNKIGEKIFIEGNEAAALGALYAGATVAAWYPITPSSSLAEAFERYCKKYRKDPKTKKDRYAILQAEDELASIGMVLGASWNGARAFTCTSGPGISLMQEFLGFGYFAEIPAVVFNVQRGGPSTGMPTRTQQSDLLSCAYASHGDTKHVMLFPEDPKESFDMSALAFDIADRLQTPVFVMLDLDIGMNERLCEPLAWHDKRCYDRGKVLTDDAIQDLETFGRYLDIDRDGISYRTYPGTHTNLGSYFTRGTTKDQYANYSESPQDYTENMERLTKKHQTAVRFVPTPVVRYQHGQREIGAVYFGSTSPAMKEALALLSAENFTLNDLRIRSYPFSQEIQEFIESHRIIFIIEQNRDHQIRTLLVNELNLSQNNLVSVLHYDGTPITAQIIKEKIMAHLKEQAT